MPDVVSLELLPDATTEAAVRADWCRLAEAGLSSLAAHPAPSNRPHITLLVRPRLGPFPLDLLQGRLPLPLRLGDPVLFGTGERRVLARQVVPSADLLRFHADVHAAAGPGADAAHTAPGSWTPHVTLARRMRLEALPAALALLGEGTTGTATALRRWDAASARVTALL